MDVKGQYDCERYFMYIMWFSTIISFASGVVADSIQVMFGLLAACFALTLILCLPEWKIYNSHPLSFQASQAPASEKSNAAKD